MRIKEIKPVNYRIYEVILAPNRLERFFGYKEKTIKLKDSGYQYMFDGQTSYFNEDGSKRGNND